MAQCMFDSLMIHVCGSANEQGEKMAIKYKGEQRRTVIMWEKA